MPGWSAQGDAGAPTYPHRQYIRNARLHEVDMDVRLVTARGTSVEFSWVSGGPDEGLAISLLWANSMPDFATRGEDPYWVDVSKYAPWPQIIEKQIVGLGMAF